MPELANISSVKNAISSLLWLHGSGASRNEGQVQCRNQIRPREHGILSGKVPDKVREGLNANVSHTK